LLLVLVVALFFGFTTSLSTVSQGVPPPEKTERHIESEALSGNAGDSRAQIDEFRAEQKRYQESWKEKATTLEAPTSPGFDVVVDRIQIPFMIVITLFAWFFKWKSLLDTVFILLVLFIFSFLFPLIIMQTLVYCVMLVLLASTFKAFKMRGEI
jgi:hypothetical protein